MSARRPTGPCLPALLASSLALLLIAAATARAADPLYLRIESGMHSAMINRIAPLADGGLVTVSNDKTVRLWNPDGTARAVLRPSIGPGDGGALYGLAVAGEKIAVVGQPPPGGAMITLIDVSAMRQLGTINMPSDMGAATSAAFLAGGSLLAVGFEHGGVRLLDLAHAKLAGEDRDYQSEVSAMAVDAQGRLAVSAADGIRLYAVGPEAESGAAALRLERRAELPDKSEPWTLAFSPDGRRLAIGSFDRPTVWVLDGASLTAEASFPGSHEGHGSLAAVAWSADGHTLYAGGGYADPEGRPLLRAWPPNVPTRGRDIPLAGSDTITDLTALPDGGLAWAAAGPSFGRLDAAGRPLFVHEREQGDFRDLYEHGFAVSEDGSRVSLALRPHGVPLLVFDLRQRLLAPAGPSLAGMAGPLSAAAGVVVEGWRNGTHPSLNGRPLALEENEIARSAAVAADGSAVALGSDFYLRLYRGGNEAWHDVLPAPAWTVGFSGDRRYVVAALGDGTLRWYASADGSEVMALFVHSDGRRWILWTPDGYFDHSPDTMEGPGGESLIGYHVDHGTKRLADFVTVDQMYDRFYRRDIVMARFAAAAGPPTAGEAVVEKALGQGLPPHVALEEVCEAPAGRCQKPDGKPLAVTTREITLKLRLEDRGGGIGEVLVRRDSAVIDGEKKRTADGANATEERRLELAPGTSHIEVSALTANGAVESGASERAKVTVDYTPKPPPASPPAGATTAVAVRGAGAPEPAAAPSKPESHDVVLYILAVGVSKYAIPSFDLGAAANDARGIAELMKSSTGKLYQKADATVLTDDDATAAKIGEAFHALAAKARPQDMVLVFLAGHGDSIDGRYYFAPHELGVKHREQLSANLTDAEWDKLEKQVFREEGIGQDRLVDWIRAVAAAHVVVMLDTCYSGRFAVEDATARAAKNETFASTLGHSAGRIVLAGANGEAIDAADAKLPAAQQHGLFTHVVLQGLEGGADFQHRGDIRVTDLAVYVKDTVPEEAAEKRNVQQPAYYFAGNDFFDLRALPKTKSP